MMTKSHYCLIAHRGYFSLQKRRLWFRLIVKLLSYLGVLILLAVFLNSLFVRDSTDKTTQQTIKQAVSINIESMYPGQIKKVRWKQKEVAVLYRRYPQRLLSQSLSQPEQNLHKSLQTKTRSQRPDYFVFVNAGDSSNCPLHYREGTFKDTCTSSTFDEAGRASAKTKTSFNIEIPPHYFSQNQIIFGTWEP